MILRKPYAFFIKIFKPIHLFMAVMIAHLVYKTNVILNFFNKYIYSNINVIGEVIEEKMISNILYIIPILIIIFCLLFLGIMFMKKKRITFYIVTIFLFVVVLIITIYSMNFLGIMEKEMVPIKLVKLYRDLILINMIIESSIFVLLIIRGLGVNFKKFNFDSDISKLNINEKDNEEFELNLNVDFDSAKRSRRKRLRHFKYVYKENKFLINIIIIVMFIVLGSVIVWSVLSDSKVNKEGVVYNVGQYNIIINRTILLNKDFSGNKLTENKLVVVDLSLQSNLNTSIFTKDFSLEIGESHFPVQTKYNELLLDLGNAYENNLLTNEFQNYILVFEVFDKYLTSDMFLNYNNKGIKTRIKLNSKEYSDVKIKQIQNLGDEISFSETIGDVTFKINSFDIQGKFLITYNFCVKKDCIVSKEYIKPTINENFDKVVLKLNVNFENKSDLNINDFYDFFNKFGDICYKSEEIWKCQTGKFEKLSSNKINEKGNVYIGINSNVFSAESIKLVFNIRDSNYEYVLK